MDLPSRHQIQAGLKIALLGPADVADGIIAPAPLVTRVVPARSIRTRVTNLQLLFVKHFPRQVSARVADDDKARPVPHCFCRLFNRRVALCRGANHGRIDPVAVGPRPHFVGQNLLTENDHFLRTHRVTKRTARRDQIDGHGSRSRRLQQIRDEQTHQSLPQHQHLVAELRCQLTDGLQCNRGQRRVGCLPVFDPCGHRRPWR